MAMNRNPVLQFAIRLMVPIILLFAFYVQFHGDFGPGGGFQAGVIFASAIILYALIQGLEPLQQRFSRRWILRLAVLGVYLYGGVGVVTLLLGGGFLDYNLLGTTAVAGQHLGILLVELGVGITVAAVMILIFMVFAARKRTP